MPDQARQDSPEGAAAFVKHYVDVFNYAAATGDVEELTRLSAPTCEGCQSYISLYRDTYAAGGYFKGADWTIGDLRLQEERSVTYATTLVKADPGPYRESSKEPEQVSSGKDNQVSFALQRSATAWQVTQIGLGAVQ
ncbi:hypothetical protein GEV27_07945 [Aeromicrobium sp. S22]|nr:hypothetical protein [Aeromicrobium sp. S22]